MTTTAYATNVSRSIRRDLATRMAERVAEYGKAFVDTIYVNADAHGEGLDGFSCEFSGHRTYGSGTTLADFARRAFGGGRLRRIDAVRFAVLRVEA